MGWEDLRVYSREQVNTDPVDMTDGKSHGKYQVDNKWKDYLAGPCSSYVMLLVMFVYRSVQDVEYGCGPQNSGNWWILGPHLKQSAENKPTRSFSNQRAKG